MSTEKTEYIISLKDLFTGPVKEADKAAQGLEGSVSSLKSTIAQLGVGIGLGAMAKGIFDAGTNMESLNVSLKTMLGSKGEADKLVAQMVKFASTTPFELSEVQTAGKQLLAYGIEAKNIIPTLRSLGDVSAGLGQPIGEIAYLYGTIKTQGKAMTVDIRQFANRGIPIYEELAKVTGKSGEALQDFIEKGKIGFPEIQKAFENMSGAGGKFAGLTSELAKTTGGQWSNMKDSIAQLAVEIFVALQPAIDWIIKSIGSLVEIVKSAVLWAKEHAKILKALAVFIGTVATAIFLYNKYIVISTALSKAYAVIQGIQMVSALTGATTAQMAFNAAMSLNPIGIVIAAIAALVAGIFALVDSYQEIDAMHKKIADDFIATKTDEETKKVLELTEAYRKQGKTVEVAQKMALEAENKRVDANIARLQELVNADKSREMQAFEEKNPLTTAEAQAQARNLAVLKAAKAQKAVLQSPDIFKGAPGEAGAKGAAGLDSSKAPKHTVITINIDKMIEKFTINTSSTSETVESIKEAVLKTMIEAVNDSQIVAGI